MIAEELDLATLDPPEFYGLLRSAAQEAAQRDHDRSMNASKLRDRIADLEGQLEARTHLTTAIRYAEASRRVIDLEAEAATARARVAELEGEVLSRDSLAIDQAQRIIRLEGDLVELRHARERIERTTVLEGVLSGLADAAVPFTPFGGDFTSRAALDTAANRLLIAVDAARALLGETPDGPRAVLVDPDHLSVVVGQLTASRTWRDGVRPTEVEEAVAALTAVLGTVPGRRVEIVATGGERL